MPKLKTHRGAAKRFKRTGTGKIVRSKAFKQHILTSKARSRKRKLRGTVEVSDGDYKKLDRMIPQEVGRATRADDRAELSAKLEQAPYRQRLRPERGATSPSESERGWGPASIK